MLADGQSLQPELIQDCTGLTQKYGSPWWLCHRVDLHNELKRLAFEDEGQGQPAKLNLGNKVVKVVWNIIVLTKTILIWIGL